MIHHQRKAAWGPAILVLGALLGAQAGPGDLQAAEPERPNIILVLTDDQRFDTLSCLGTPVVQTPNIDRLAQDGVLFRNAFVTTAICSISRASIMTGQYERRHQVDSFRKPFTPEQLAQTFPLLLRKHGYRTGIVGKWGIGGELPVDAYDYFKGYSGQGRYFPKGQVGTGEHLTHKLGDQVIEFLDGCDASQPFMLQYYSKAAHCQDGDPWPFQPDPRYNHLFADETVPVAETATQAEFEKLPPFLQNSEGRTRWKIRFETPELYQKSVKDYYRLIYGMDDVVGRIVRKLNEKGLAENTVIIFTSDNGFYLAEHGLAGKWYMHEESIRVPMVIYDPRLPGKLKNRRLDQMVLNIDVPCTILDFAGVPIPAGMQGVSLLPLVRGENPKWRDEFFYEHRIEIPTIPKSEGVRNLRWKYIRYTESQPLVESLFDLQTDPHEQHDLAGEPEYAAQLAKLRDRWQTLSVELQ